MARSMLLIDNGPLAGRRRIGAGEDGRKQECHSAPVTRCWCR